MGGTIFTIFIIIIILNVLGSVGEKQIKSKSKYKSRSQSKNPWHEDQDGQAMSRETQQALRQRAKEAQRTFSKKAASQASTAALRRHLKSQSDTRIAKHSDIKDQNRARLSNWGERAGPGFLTISNLLVVLALGGVALYIISLN